MHMSHFISLKPIFKTSTASDTDYLVTYSELGGSRGSPMETEHDNLQAVTAIGAFEEAWLQQVRGNHGRQVDPPICQAVTVKRKQTSQAHQNYIDGSCEPSLKITSHSSFYRASMRKRRVLLVLTGINELHQDELLHVLMEDFFQCPAPFFFQPCPELLHTCTHARAHPHTHKLQKADNSLQKVSVHNQAR